MSTPALATVLALGCAAACTTPDALPEPRTGGAPVGEPAIDRVGRPPVVAPLATDGSYRLDTELDVEAGALLPATAHDAMLALEGLRDHPSQTLFALADDAGVPAVGTLRDALPSTLESRLDGWIDTRIRSVTTGDGTLAQVLDGLLGIGRADVAEVRLQSRLTLAGGAGTHRLDTVELTALDRSLAYDVAPLAGAGFELEVPVATTVRPDGVAATLALGGHGFGLPYGKLAWRAFDDLVKARYGGRDLRAVLGDQLDCAGMAASVANQCVLSLCVGHASELRAICEGGLDRAVAQLRTRVEAATVEPIALDAGAATLVDGDDDRTSSAIAAGTWTARLDLGQGLRPAPATFSGARE